MLGVHAIITDFQIAANEVYAPFKARETVVEIPLGDSFEDLVPDEFFPEELVAQLKSLHAKKRARLAALLTPNELDEHELRSHRSVEGLHRVLGAFEPTEAEFRALFAVHRDFDANFRPNPDTTRSEMLAAEARLQSQFAAALGPARYAEYQHVVDPASSRLNRLVARLGLPVSAAMQVTALKREVNERATALRANSTLDLIRRDGELAALAHDVGGKVSRILGARGLEAYQRYGGYWLDLIHPTQPTSRPSSMPAP
jgi:hypothetical protein